MEGAILKPKKKQFFDNRIYANITMLSKYT